MLVYGWNEWLKWYKGWEGGIRIILLLQIALPVKLSVLFESGLGLAVNKCILQTLGQPLKKVEK